MAMAQMFCTLKQAADKLETTEAKIEAMLNDGILREFRDGSSRLLKVADLAGLTVAAGAATGVTHPARAQHKARSTQPQRDGQGRTMLDTQIRLPPAPTATARVSPPRSAAPQRAPRRCQPPAEERPIPRPVVRKPVASQRRQNPPHAVVISPAFTPQRARPQTYEMSLRQWIWTGLIDDSPLAIFIVFGTVLIGVCALAGAAYLLLRAL